MGLVFLEHAPGTIEPAVLAAPGTLDRSDESWGLWSIPSYVCSGDSGGGIFLMAGSSRAAERLVANVSDGGKDCRRHNNNNRLDTRAIQEWIADTVTANRKP